MEINDYFNKKKKYVNKIGNLKNFQPDILEKEGYHTEVHFVNTSDGYILPLHRILSKSDGSKPPVFLMHGLFESSTQWIIMGVNHSLGEFYACFTNDSISI